MKSPPHTAWALPNKTAFNDLRKSLTSNYGLQQRLGRVKRVDVLDDYDFSLWHANAGLIKITQRDYLFTRDSDEIEVSALAAPARFWWDFPAGEVQTSLKRLSPLRAFVPFAWVRFVVHHYDLTNADDKVVVRLKLIQHYAADTPQSHKVIGIYIQAQALRGYESDFRRVGDIVNAAGVKPAPLPTMRQLLINQGQQIRAKPDKRFGIKGEMAAEVAVRKMGLGMMTIAQSQRAGILADTDTEFLHQYRVHLRKLRSLIALTKQCLTPELLVQLKGDLAEVFAPTSDLRDLDVFLLEQSSYQLLLPDEFRAGVEKLFQKIARERQSAYRRLCGKLKTKHYQTVLARISALLKQDPEFSAEASRRSIHKLAAKRIGARYRKIRRIGHAITANTPDNEVHALRIECKKLRYLLEFFTELFDKKTILKLTKQLKRLQDILGEFNDYSVQQQFLLQLAEKERAKTVLAAIHGLVAVLNQKQIRARDRVTTACTVFASGETTALVKSLLTSNPRKVLK